MEKQKSQYEIFLEEFIDRISFLEGTLYHLEKDLKGFIKQFNNKTNSEKSEKNDF